jgi:hypothetical protein
MAAGAARTAGTVTGGVVMAGGAITGDLDVAGMIKIDRIEQLRETIDLDLCRGLIRGGDTAYRPQKTAQKHAKQQMAQLWFHNRSLLRRRRFGYQLPASPEHLFR